MTQADLLQIQHIRKQYPNGTLAVEDISCEARRGEFVSIVGPSGAGKTTLLKMVCGLLQPSAGKVLLHGKQIISPPPEMILVFQDYHRSLFPWLTVGGNVMFPLKNMKQLSKAQKEQATREAVQAVGLEDAIDKYPWQLSGGMQQRVAIARAIAFHPEILLLDEPFASVDALTRMSLEDLTLQLRHKFGITVLLVTHDIEEAVYLSDRVLVLSPPPSVIVQEFAVDLEGPREQTTTRSSPAFWEVRNKIHDLIIGKRPQEADKEEGI